MERFHTWDSIAPNRVAELREQLKVAEDRMAQSQDRLTLSPQERAVLDGRSDGCALLGNLRPMVRRMFGEVACR